MNSNKNKFDESHIRNFKYKLRNKVSEEIQKIKTLYNQFKIEILQEVNKIRKDSVQDIHEFINQLETENDQQKSKQVKYHEKNTRTLGKLEKELKNKTMKIIELEQKNAEQKHEVMNLEEKIQELTSNFSDLQIQHRTLEKEYQVWLEKMTEKTKELQRLRYNPSQADKVEEAKKLTEIISAEIQKKYKEKLIQVLSLCEENSAKHKNKIFNIRKLVMNQKIQILDTKDKNPSHKNYQTEPTRNGKKIFYYEINF